MQWRPFPAVVTAVLAILTGFYFNATHNRDLNAARAETRAAQHQAALAVSVTIAALDFADEQTARADSLEVAAAAAAASAARRAPAIAALPDTCAPAIAAAAEYREAYELELQAAQELRAGLDSVVPASEALVTATGRLDAAATVLVQASKPSWLARLKPDVGIGAAVGIDPVTKKPSTTVGVTLSWRIL